MEKVDVLLERMVKTKFEYRPKLFRLNNLDERGAFYSLLEKNPNIHLFNEIKSQLFELIKIRNPTQQFSKEQLEAKLVEYLAGKEEASYGVWVYYPWSERAVHLLDEAEFIEVRTNRNQYKITPEECHQLSKKKIGVIGLSVGQSISVTMAMERCFGEIRLADFDTLELSNMNRIRTGVHNLGIPKVLLVAREIAEIDPFLRVVPFFDGINTENIDQFITQNGKLDLLVDECDDLYMKILSRQKAKALRIPVVMETSDRGMIDIERFDLEPTRPILHGLIDHMDISKLKKAKTYDEKIPFLMPILGIDTISDRLKVSMLEIKRSISTWPQLASSVTMGGGVGTDVSRKILLNQLSISGRFYVDIDEIISDTNVSKKFQKKTTGSIQLRQDTLEIINEPNANVTEKQLDLDRKTVIKLVTAASQAPSSGNYQPWKWIYKDKKLFLYLNVSNDVLLDSLKTTTLVGLGAATENLVLMAHSLDLKVKIETKALGEKSQLVSVFNFFDKSTPDNVGFEKNVCDELVSEIPLRLTNRSTSNREKIERSDINSLIEIARTIPGADLILVEDKMKLTEFESITGKLERIRMLHEGEQAPLIAEMRWADEVNLLKSGIELSGKVNLTLSELTDLRMARDPQVVKLLRDWNLGFGLEKILEKNIEGTSALALITMPEFNHLNFYNGGRALERIWLSATQKNIQVHPLSVSTLIFNTLHFGDKNIFQEQMKNEVERLQLEFCKIFSINPQVGQILLLRFFKGGSQIRRSVRYPIEQILSFS